MRIFLLYAFALLLPIPLCAQNPTGRVLQGFAITGNSLNNFVSLQARENYGAALDTLGDLDGDGVVDLAVGVSGTSNNTPTDGAVFIQFMNADGTVKDLQRIDADSGNFTGTLLAGNPAFGDALTYLGDLDGDGKPELAIGAPGQVDLGFNPADTGRVYIVSLNPDGTVARTVSIGQDIPELGRDDHFGYALANAGDLNGDGRPELVVGMHGYNSGRGGFVTLFLRADGTLDRYQFVSEIDGSFGRVLNGTARFGSSLAGIGDINNDEVPDLAVGCYGYDEGGSFAGAVWIVPMQDNGDCTTGSSVYSPNLPMLRDTVNAFDYFGWSVAAIGDLDGDGLTEIAASAPRASVNGRSRAGRVFILYPAGYGVLRTFTTIAEGESNFPFPASTGDFFGNAVAALGDFDGDGTPDLVASETGSQATGQVNLLTLFGRGTNAISGEAKLLPTGNVRGGTAYLFDLFDRSAGLDGWDTLLRVPVGNDGSFTFRNVPSRSYAIKVSPDTTLHPDYRAGYWYTGSNRPLSQSYRFHTDLEVRGDTTLPTPVYLTKRPPPVVFGLPSGYGIAYKSNQNKTDEPAPNVPYALYEAGVDTPYFYAFTNTEGEFTLPIPTGVTAIDVWFDVPGTPVDSTSAYNISVPGDPTALELYAYIESDAIYIRDRLLNIDRTQTLGRFLRVGPIPARDFLRIETAFPQPQEATFTLRDLTGRSLRQRVSSAGREVINFPVEGLASGVYLLEMRTAAGRVVRKVRVE